MEPATPNSLVSQDRKLRIERNSPLGSYPIITIKQNRNGAMEAYTHKKQPPAKPFIGLQTQFTQNEATYALQQGSPAPSTAGTRIQKEFRMHSLNRLPPTFLLDLWQTKDKISAPHTLTEGRFILSNWRKGNIT
jgi:hypothetical protein